MARHGRRSPGSGPGEVAGERGGGLAEVIGLVRGRERARQARRFRAAAALGMAVPALMLASGYFFISSVVRPGCLRLHGALGACDPLHQVVAVTVIGQVVILAAAAGAVLRSRRRRRPRRAAGMGLAVVLSAGWAVLTGLFAAGWMSGHP